MRKRGPLDWISAVLMAWAVCGLCACADFAPELAPGSPMPGVGPGYAGPGSWGYTRDGDAKRANGPGAAQGGLGKSGDPAPEQSPQTEQPCS